MDNNTLSTIFDISLSLADDFQRQLDVILETAQACLEKVVQECSTLRAQAAKSQETSTQTMQRYANLEAQMVSIRVQLQGKKDALDQVTRANRNFHQAQHKTQKKITDYQAKISQLEKTMTEKQVEFASLQQDHVKLQKIHGELQKEHTALQDEKKAEGKENQVFLALAKKSIAAPAGAGAPSDVVGKIVRIEQHIEDLKNQIQEGNDEIDLLVDKNDRLKAARREKYDLYKRMTQAEGEDVARLAQEFGEAMERNNTSSEESVEED